jgi:hypothetical protein
MTEAKQAEPRSWLQSRHFMVGQDRRGNWVVQDPRGNCGGFFVDRDAALRFVRAENGYRAPAVVMPRAQHEPQPGHATTTRNSRRPAAPAPVWVTPMSAIGRRVSKLSGYAPALPTPFDDQDDSDVDAFARLCDLQIANGATALVVCGTTGERQR